MSKKKFRNVNTYRERPRRQILLSISILVSGRGESMEKCIASLDRLRERVHCELILTDTGCSPETREWLKQKADKLLRFDWCDDFAAARNVGLRAASGLWFMFMDDDEWFEDTTRIENFFLTGEYRRYQSATYIVRNYVNMEGTQWRDTSLSRMTVRRPDTRFFYPIHESLWPLLDPVKNFDDYAHHYGYAASDPETMMAKRKRNLDILIPAIEKDPHCMKHYLQGVSEYQAMDDYESACKMADAGIAHCIPGRPENAVHIDGLYAAAVRMRLRTGRSLEVVRLGKDYLENVPLSDLAKASLCGDLAIAYGELGEDKLCLRYLRDYLDWKEYFETHRDEWLKQETVVLESCFENFQYRKAMGWGLAASLSLGDGQRAEELLADGSSLAWWMDAARHWYVMTSEQRREKWQRDFWSLCRRLEDLGQLGKCPQALQWEEGGAAYSRLGQLYGVLTLPESEETSGQEQEAPAEDSTVSAAPVSSEMEALALQLKGKVRQLMRQGQYQASLDVIVQMQAYFPEDSELLKLREECEKGLI